MSPFCVFVMLFLIIPTTTELKRTQKIGHHFTAVSNLIRYYFSDFLAFVATRAVPRAATLITAKTIAVALPLSPVV